MGPHQGEECGVAEVYDEMRQAMHAAISGITWERLQRESSVTYPCLSAEDPGQPIVFVDDFPTDDGRVIWEFDAPEGDELLVSYDARIEPAAQEGRRGSVALLGEGGVVLVQVDVTTRLMP